MADITPPRMTELIGQYYQRVSTVVRDPLSVKALALEQAGPVGKAHQAVFVSCDQACISRREMEDLRVRLRTALPDFDPSKLIVSATHTHCAPAAEDILQWRAHDPKYLFPAEFRLILLDGLQAAVTQAWHSRAAASAGVAAGLTSVGHCRRPRYSDGSAQMYGCTDGPDFAGMEAGEDDTDVVTADMFGEMRRLLRARYGEHLKAVCHVGPACDMAPRDLTRPHRGGPTFWDEAGLEVLIARLADRSPSRASFPRCTGFSRADREAERPRETSSRTMHMSCSLRVPGAAPQPGLPDAVTCDTIVRTVSIEQATPRAQEFGDSEPAGTAHVSRRESARTGYCDRFHSTGLHRVVAWRRT